MAHVTRNTSQLIFPKCIQSKKYTYKQKVILHNMLKYVIKLFAKPNPNSQQGFSFYILKFNLTNASLDLSA